MATPRVNQFGKGSDVWGMGSSRSGLRAQSLEGLLGHDIFAERVRLRRWILGKSQCSSPLRCPNNPEACRKRGGMDPAWSGPCLPCKLAELLDNVLGFGRFMSQCAEVAAGVNFDRVLPGRPSRLHPQLQELRGTRSWRTCQHTSSEKGVTGRSFASAWRGNPQ